MGGCAGRDQPGRPRPPRHRSRGRHPLGRPHLTLTADLNDFAGISSNRASGTGAGQVTLGGAGYLTATHLARAAADRLSCDAAVSLIGHDRGALTGTEQTIGRRMPNRHERRALAARDRGCRFPGCTRPAQRCQPHHVIHHAHGGPTTPENLILLCSEHHRTVHDDGWTLTFDGRTAIFTDPHGRRYESPPPLAQPPPWEPPPDDPFIGPVWIPSGRQLRPAVPQAISPALADRPPL